MTAYQQMDPHHDAIEGPIDAWQYDANSRLDHMDKDRIIDLVPAASQMGRHVLEHAIEDAELTESIQAERDEDAAYYESHRTRAIAATLVVIAALGAAVWCLIAFRGVL